MIEQRRLGLAVSAVAGQAVEPAGMPVGVSVVVGCAASGRATGGAGTAGAGRNQARHTRAHLSRAPSKAASGSKGSCCACGPELVAGADSSEAWRR